MTKSEEMLESIKKHLPQVTVTKTGYEIRTEILAMAKEYSEFEFNSKWMGWERSVKVDSETGQILDTVHMPDVPGVDKILETADRFLEFVNRK